MADNELKTTVTLDADDQLAPVAEKLETAFKQAQYASMGLMGAIEEALDDKHARAAAKIAEQIEKQKAAADKAAAAALKWDRNWKTAFKEAGGMAEKFRAKIESLGTGTATKVLGAVGLGFGIHQAIGAATEGRQEMEAMTDAVKGVNIAFKNWKEGVTFIEKMQAASEESEQVFERMEKLSYRLSIPTEKLTVLYQKLGGPVFGTLNKSQEEMNNLITMTAESAKVMGADVQAASVSITKALSLGVVEGEDPLSLHLRTALGNMSKLTAEQRYRKVVAQLKGMGTTADQLATSMTDVVFRLHKFVGDFVRDISGPALTYVLDRLNDWRESLEGSVGHGKDLVKEIGDKLLKSVKAIEKVGGFILDHWKEIAFVIGGIKFGGLAGSAAAGAGGMLSSFTGPLGQVGGQLSQFGAKLPMAIGALGVFAAALNVGAEWLDAWQGDNIAAKGTAEGLATVLDAGFKGNQETVQKIAMSMGVMTKQGTVNAAAIERGFSQMSDERLQGYAKTLGLGSGASAGLIAAKFAEEIRKGYVAPRVPPPTNEVGNIKTSGLTKKHVTQNFNGGIQIKQDFKEADPGRVFVRFKSDLEGLSERRLQSNEAEVFGP